MNKIKCYLFILWLSFKSIFRINLGDTVLYKNKKYQINNGNIHGCWTILDEKLNPIYAKINEVKKVWSFSDIIWDFKSSYKFYMGYWYGIWVSEGIQEWMKKCSIWGNPRKC